MSWVNPTRPRRIQVIHRSLQHQAVTTRFLNWHHHSTMLDPSVERVNSHLHVPTLSLSLSLSLSVIIFSSWSIVEGRRIPWDHSLSIPYLTGQTITDRLTVKNISTRNAQLSRFIHTQNMASSSDRSSITDGNIENDYGLQQVPSESQLIASSASADQQPFCFILTNDARFIRRNRQVKTSACQEPFD